MAEIKRLLSRRVYDLRKKAGLTQEELARAADVGLDAIGRLERGEVTPSVETLARIAGVFQMTLSELFDFEAAPSPTPLRAEIDELALFLATKSLPDVRFLSQMIRTTLDYLDQVRRRR